MSDNTKAKATSKELSKLLKQAKTELQNEDFDECISLAKKALKLDKNNIYGHLFIAKSFKSKGMIDEAIKVYEKATLLNPEHELAWKSLLSLRLDSTEFVPFFETILGYSKALLKNNQQLTEVVDLVKSYNQKHQLSTFEYQTYYLKQIIPGLSELGDIIGYQINPPVVSLKELIKINEVNEAKLIKRQDEKTKMILSVSMAERTKIEKLNEKRWDILSDSEIPQLYEILIDLDQDDSSRYKAQDVYLKYKHNMLFTAPAQMKDSLRDDVKDIVDGMVLIKCPSKLAWNIYFEWFDPHFFSDLYLENLCTYIKLFGKETEYGAVFYNFLLSDICPFDKSRIVDYIASKKSKKNHKSKNENENDQQNQTDQSEPASNQSANEQAVDERFKIFDIEPQQILTNMVKSIENIKQSVICHRIALEYCVHLKDYSLGLEISSKLSKAFSDMKRGTGLNMSYTKLAHTLNLAAIYTYYEAPKNFSKALELYQSIENKDPDNSKIKIGKALILVETKRFEEAAQIFESLMQQNPNDVSAIQEYGWCQVHMHNFSLGRQYLEKAIDLLEDESNDIIKGGQLIEILSTVTYRLALSYHLEIEIREDELDRDTLKTYVNTCSALLLKCLKLSPNYAPAFTTLGSIYYNYLGNKDRAIQIFNKAFQLDPAEIEASYKLAEHFTSINDWEMAGIICKGVIENDRARRQLSSTFNKLKDNSWPYRILGCASMELKNDVKAIEYFQTSLRLNPVEIASWVGLGEAYMSRGRIEASIKVFTHVIRLQSQVEDVNAEITTEMQDNADWHVIYLWATSLTNMMEFEKSTEVLSNLLIKKEDAKRSLCVPLMLIETLILRCESEIRKGAILRASDSLKQIYEHLFKAFEIETKSIKLWKLLSDSLCISLKIQSSLDNLPIEKLEKITSSVLSSSNELWEGFNFQNYNIEELKNSGDYVSIGHFFLILSSIGGYLCSRSGDVKVLRASLVFNIAISFASWFTQSNEEIFRDFAIKILNKAIALEPDNPDYWNCLGVVSMSKNAKISQHCFIKALAIESKSSLYWFNLGMLYVKHNDYELANECFLKTQSLSPSSSAPWTGLAILNNELGKIPEARNLFTHSYVLSKGTSPENTLLYAVSVLNAIVTDGSEERNLDAIQQLSTVNHGMLNYLKHYPKDIYALEMTINVIERLFSFNNGIEFSEKLCSLLEAQYEEDESETTLISYCKAKSQLARFLLGNKDYEQAFDLCEEVGSLLESVDSFTLEVQKCLLSCFTVLGLSLYFQGKFDESLNEFKKLLDAFPENQKIVILISQVLYASGNEEAKQAAMDELLANIESQGTTLLISMIIAAISLVEDWEDYIVAVKEVLDQLDLNLLISDTYKEIPTLLSMISAKIKKTSDREDKIWQRNAFMFLGDHTAWKNIDEEVALELSMCSDKESAIAVSEAYVNVARLREAQRGILLSGGISEKGLSLLQSLNV